LGSRRRLDLAVAELRGRDVAERESFAGLAGLNRLLVRRAEATDSVRRTTPRQDSTETPVYGEQEQSACNGYTKSTCYHPLLLFRLAIHGSGTFGCDAHSSEADFTVSMSKAKIHPALESPSARKTRSAWCPV
jgi:hypothetical protein